MGKATTAETKAERGRSGKRRKHTNRLDTKSFDNPLLSPVIRVFVIVLCPTQTPPLRIPLLPACCYLRPRPPVFLSFLDGGGGAEYNLLPARYTYLRPFEVIESTRIFGLCTSNLIFFKATMKKWGNYSTTQNVPL